MRNRTNARYYQQKAAERAAARSQWRWKLRLHGARFLRGARGLTCGVLGFPLWLYWRVAENGRSCAFDKDKNAFGPLQFLATFLIAQGAALVGAVQFSESRLAPSIIYFLLFAVTSIGIIAILRLRKPMDRNTHYFDQGTIVFGRWTLGTAVTSMLIILVLLALNLFPLSGRVIRDSSPIILSPLVNVTDLTAQVKSLNGRPFDENATAAMNGFALWLERGAVKAEPKPDQVVAVCWSEPFEEDYHSFSRTIIGLDTAQDFMLFVYSDAGEAGAVQAEPRFQLAIPITNNAGKLPRTFELRRPNKGDRALLFVLMPAMAGQPQLVVPTGVTP